MKLTYFGYNAFAIEAEGRLLLLDPGMDLHWRRLDSLIPNHFWPQATLVLVTHGDADHATFAVRVARASRAPVVCGRDLAKRWGGEGLALVPVEPDGTVEAAGVEIRGVRVRHGPDMRLFGRTFSNKPWFVGVGATGLLVTIGQRRLLALGDTMLIEGEWGGLHPEVLMVPVGGMMTMNVDEALRALASISPQIVIPVHHNWDVLFYHRPANAQKFVTEARQLGLTCRALERGESVELG